MAEALQPALLQDAPREKRLLPECCFTLKAGASTRRWHWVPPPCCEGAWEKYEEELKRTFKCLALVALFFCMTIALMRMILSRHEETVWEAYIHQQYSIALAWVLQMCKAIVNKFGLAGLYFAIFIADYVPPGFPMEPVILIAVLAQVPKLAILVSCFCGSYTAATLGYWTGHGLATMRCSAKHLSNVSSKYPEVLDVLQKRGAWGVGLCALLPLPFPPSTWMAGALSVKFAPDFLLAASLRGVKISIYMLVSIGVSMAAQQSAAPGASTTAPPP